MCIILMGNSDSQIRDAFVGLGNDINNTIVQPSQQGFNSVVDSATNSINDSVISPISQLPNDIQNSFAAIQPGVTGIVNDATGAITNAVTPVVNDFNIAFTQTIPKEFQTISSFTVDTANNAVDTVVSVGSDTVDKIASGGALAINDINTYGKIGFNMWKDYVVTNGPMIGETIAGFALVGLDFFPPVMLLNALLGMQGQPQLQAGSTLSVRDELLLAGFTIAFIGGAYYVIKNV